MHRTIKPIATAHSRYASGASVPSWAAMSAGSRKMPPPIVTLTMPAASANGPMLRTSEDSDIPRRDSSKGPAVGDWRSGHPERSRGMGDEVPQLMLERASESEARLVNE